MLLHSSHLPITKAPATNTQSLTIDFGFYICNQQKHKAAILEDLSNYSSNWIIKRKKSLDCTASLEFTNKWSWAL